MVGWVGFGTRGNRLLVLFFTAAALCLTFACTKPCPRCEGAGKIIVKKSCPTCKGTGTVITTCERCGGKKSIAKEVPCPYCGGKGERKCTYTEVFPTNYSGGRWRSNRNETIIRCVNGRLQADDPTVDSAYGKTNPSRVCPRCSGHGIVPCTFCKGTGTITVVNRCPICYGTGTVLKACPKCSGTGELTVISPCPECGGTGHLSRFTLKWD